ncbi:hypothetical protein SAMN04489740_2275 [Arthrobacter alpinus]|uniref:Uncharacterized protein n=1 Tax=Arthrobacter alpinus TaxID=656366 RepID=A0A1H5L2K9_9MICC|nr:hypothetical protein SAMN04489740_2275 [Arthrobacter alpinus]
MNEPNSTKWSMSRKVYLLVGILICGVAIVMMTYPR